MTEIVKTKFHDSEVAKSSDFGHTASEPLAIITAMVDGAFRDVEKSFVFSGMEVSQSDPATMNVLIKAGMAFDRFSSKVLHLAADLLVPVTASNTSQSRLDTLEIRYKETDIDTETRAFKDPANGTVSYMNVPTRTLIGIEARCLAGTPGAGSAPLTEFGWVKLAEVLVDAGATAIQTAKIRGITATRDGMESAAWTVEKGESFTLGSLDALKAAFAAHEAGAITSGNAVHGIRQGHTNGFDADTLDGSHASSFERQDRTAGTYVEFYHSVEKSNSSNAKVIEFKVQKSGTYTTKILMYSDSWTEDVTVAAGDLIQLYAYQNLVGSGQYTVYARVYKNGSAVGTQRSVSAGDIGGNYTVALALMCAEEGWLNTLG